LIGTPFVEDASDGWKYHAVIREEFLSYAARESTSNLAQVHQRLAEFHTEKRKELFEENNIEDAMAHGAEVRYHGVASGAKDAILAANRVCLQLWAIHPELARASAVSLRDGERDQVGGRTSEWGDAWVNAVDEYSKGHEQPAIELFGELLSSLALEEDDRSKALMTRGDLYFRQDRYEFALEDIEAAIELDRSNPQPYYERAWVHQRCHRPEKAFEDVESALNLIGDEPAPGFCDLYLHCASELLEGADMLELARAMGGEDGEIWSQIAVGRALREMGHHPEAVTELERVAEIAGQPIHRASEQIGRSYLDAENYGKAERAFKAALETNPSCVLCWSALSQAAMETAEEADEVEATLRETCKEIDQPGVRAARGVALLEAGFSNGLDDLRAAIEQNPVRPEFHCWLGQALEQLGKPREGIEALEEALRLRPDWPQALMVRGACRNDLEEFGPALEDWEKVERIESPDLMIVSHCNWGLALSIVGRYAEAIAHFDVELAEEASPQLVYNRAVARAGLVGVEEVAEEITQALADMSDAEDNLVRHYGRGGLMALRGEAGQALNELVKACETAKGEMARGWARNDPAWNSVRTKSEFKKIVS
jgi:tetratricopeptide (TPR) repeat protein